MLLTEAMYEESPIARENHPQYLKAACNPEAWLWQSIHRHQQAFFMIVDLGFHIPTVLGCQTLQSKGK